MLVRDSERYRDILTQVLRNYQRRRRMNDEPTVHPDVNDLAAANHARYIADVKEEIHLSICEAARRALARLEEGDYGKCVDCGQAIGPKRLEAVPWTDCCVECQAERENSNSLEKVA